MSQKLIVGIDLGTTNSCIAVKRNGRTEVIPNSDGKRITHSYVYYGKRGSVTVGKTARHESAVRPTNGIYEIKRIIGCMHDDPDIENERAHLTYNLIRGANGDIKIGIENEFGQKFEKYPEEICARILYKLKTDAERYLNETIAEAVITVPAYFNNNQRAATRAAAKLAQLHVTKLINEPSAAALAYVTRNFATHDTPRNILIYDLGGGTFDVSIVRHLGRGKIRVISVDGDTHLGGQDFLNRLVAYVTDQLETKYGKVIRNNPRFMWKMARLCERVKKILTNTPETTIQPEFALNDDCEELIITREQFELINKDLFELTIKIVDNCIKNRRLNKSDIDEVLLVGGSSRIPKIEQLLKDYFGQTPINRNINADEAIAIGAAIEAGFITENEADSSLIADILPLSIGTVINNETIFFNFARNTQLPAECRKNYIIKRKKDFRRCLLSFYEGEHLDRAKNVLLGAREIRWENARSEVKFEVRMQIKRDGIIHVVAKGERIKSFTIVLNQDRIDEEILVKIGKEIESFQYGLI